MANYREDIVDIDLKGGKIHRSFLEKSIGEGDKKADRFGVRVFRNKVPETLSGTCSGLFIRADSGTVTITDGVVSGNVAYVTLPEACYAIEGHFTLAIKITTANDITTMRIVDGTVSRTSTDTPVDPGNVLPSIDDLIATINAAVNSIPADYSAMDKNEKQLLEDIRGNVVFYANTSQAGWTKVTLVPAMAIKKDDYFKITVTLDETINSNLYIYLKNGDTEITNYNMSGYAERNFTYKATADMNNFKITTNAQSYDGRVLVRMEKASEQSEITEQGISIRELAKEEKGFYSLQRLAPFVHGGYDYPSFNYNTFQVSSSEIMTAPFGMYIRIASGYKAQMLKIVSGEATNSGWQTESLYVPAGTDFIIKIEKVSHGGDEVADINAYVQALKVFDDTAFQWQEIRDYADSWEPSNNILYATGEKNSASFYWQIYKYKNPQFKWVRAHVNGYARDVAEIAFYSSEEIDEDYYMGSESMNAGSWDQDHYVYAKVPDGAKLMCICTRDQYTNGDPFNPEVFVDNDQQYKTVELEHRLSGLSMFQDFKYLYHFNANNLGSAEVPSQSLFDIDIAHRLGFRAFELNVHRTATPGKYVCMHGSSGKIGTELVARDGVTDISNYRFEDVTAQEFLEDFVYNTSNPQYRTHVTFLDEAVAMCRKYNMVPWFSWADYPAIEYFEKLAGSRYVLIIYDSYYIRRANYKGTYNLYQTRTAEQLKETLKKSGAPLMYSITTDQLSLTNAELKELAEICHENGSMIGFAGVYQTAKKNAELLNLGYDFMSSGWEVEDFDSGNAISKHSNGTFTEFTHDGTVSGEVLALANGGEIKVERTGETPFLSKASLKIRFSGTLVFNMGDYIDDVSIISDGSRDIVLTTAFFRQQPVFTAEADGAVNIYSCVYDASIC